MAAIPTLNFTRRAVSIGLLVLVGYKYSQQKEKENKSLRRRPSTKPLPNLPSRSENVERLHKIIQTNEEFDIVIVGGGAIGCGIALDAASRGLNVCLLESEDFAAGNSSRSTKLFHGNFAFFKHALQKGSLHKLSLVQEALRERTILIANSPHLTEPQQILIPLSRWVDVPLQYTALALYHELGKWCGSTFDGPKYLSHSEALQLVPALNHEQLKAAMLFTEGKHNDSRMGLYLALTAAHWGACTLNHMHVTDVLKGPEGKVCGVKVQDKLNNMKSFDVHSKVVVNACGSQIDTLLKLTNADHEPLVRQTPTLRMSLRNAFFMNNVGLLHFLNDGSPLFMLPWMGRAVVGISRPAASSQGVANDDVVQLSQAIQQVMPSCRVSENICSTWTEKQAFPASESTETKAKGYAILADDSSGLVTVAGGSWTLYRKIAEDAVNKAVQVGGLEAKASLCATWSLTLLGGHRYTNQLPFQLSQQFNLERTEAQQLAERYGDRASNVAQLMSRSNPPFKVLSCFPAADGEHKVWEAEVQYAVAEYACTALDFLLRRSGLALLDYEAAVAATPTVVRLMGEQLGWSKKQQRNEVEETLRGLNSLRPQKPKQ